MPKTETQTIKVQDVRKDDVVWWNEVKYAVTGRTTKTKFVYVDTTHPGTTLRIEHGTDVQVERQVPTAAEKYADMRAMVIEEIHKFIASAKAGREKARAQVVDYVAKDHRLDWSPLGELIAADATWELAALLVPEDGREVTDDELLDEARYLVKRETNALLSNHYRGGSSSSISNTIDEARREAASKFASPTGFSVGSYVSWLDKMPID